MRSWTRTSGLRQKSLPHEQKQANAALKATQKRLPKRAANEGRVQPGEKVKKMLKMVILTLSPLYMTCEQREQVSVACGGRGGGVRGGAAPPRTNARERAHKARAARAIDVELRARAGGSRHVHLRAVRTCHHRPHEHRHNSSDRVERTGLPNKQSRAHT